MISHIMCHEENKEKGREPKCPENQVEIRIWMMRDDLGPQVLVMVDV